MLARRPAVAIMAISLIAACDGRPIPTSDGASDPDAAVAVDFQQAPEARPAQDSAPVPDLLQEFCQANTGCLPSEYCHLESGCLVTGAKMGACASRPQHCPFLLAPVCGCDNKSYDNVCFAHQAGVNIKSEGSCPSNGKCQGVTCHLYDGCCECSASSKIYPPAPCPNPCQQTMCNALGFAGPQAYCVGGKCLVANTQNSCISDTDCKKIDDCCVCGALPKSVSYISCPAMCFVDSCLAVGLSNAVPRCLQGVCKLAMP